MKIALVNDTVFGYASGDPLAVGGAERYTWLAARALAAHGWSSTVGVRAGLKSGERCRIDGVEFVGIGEGQLLPAFYHFLTCEKPQWCFWFCASHLLGPAVAVGKLTGTRTVFSAQFDLDVRPREALYGRRHLWPFYALGLSGSNKIFVQHGSQYDDLPPRWRAKAFVIPGVVELPDFFKPHAERRKYVAWVGVLRYPKRPDLLVEIARRLPNVDFVVCGGPSAHRSPQGYSEGVINEFKTLSNINYLGCVAPERAIEIIGDSALLLSTSEGEGFPSVFLEAWANGTPVLSLKIDPDRLIARKGLGVMSEGVEAAIRDIPVLMESSHRRQDIALRARDHIARVHNGAAVAEVVERALTD